MSNVHFQSIQIAPALQYLDREARFRGHCVIIQEVYRSEGCWLIRAWAKGAEDCDSLYEELFRHLVMQRTGGVK
jgi:hypothetical protein